MHENSRSLIKQLIGKYKFNLQNVECQQLSQFIEDHRPDLAEKITTKDILKIIEEEKIKSLTPNNNPIKLNNVRVDKSYNNMDKHKIINDYLWPNGNKYVGEWKDGKMNGHGEYTWVTGISYKGEFKNGKLDGPGLWYWSYSEDPLYDGMAIDSEYAQLIVTMIYDGITTIEKVKELNFMQYLNKKNLYDLKTRMILVSKANEIFGIENRINSDKFHGEKDYIKESIDVQNISTENQNDQIVAEIEKYLKQKQSSASFDEIKNFKTGLKLIRLRSILDASTNIVNVKGRYLYRDNIYGFDKFADVILSALETQFSINSGHTTASLLYAAVQNRLEDFFFDNGFESASEVFALTQHLFGKEKYKAKCFIFARSFHIWENEPDYPKTYAGLFIKWARENNGIISREYCHERLNCIGASSIDALFTNTYYTIRDLLWQFEPYRFVLAEYVDTNENCKDVLKERLTSLFTGAAFIPLRDIEDHWFETLPSLPIGVNWTPLLLQEVVTYVDVGYKTISAGYGQSFDVVHAAIVPKYSNIETFGDVVWRVVDEEFGTPTNMIATEELRQALIKRNILFGNERLWSLHKAIGNDLRYRWTDSYSKVQVFNI